MRNVSALEGGFVGEKPVTKLGQKVDIIPPSFLYSDTFTGGPKERIFWLLWRRLREDIRYELQSRLDGVMRIKTVEHPI